jgi:flagellar M-ring protein FliF
MVPAEKVYELRLSLAGDGIPNRGNIGFEIFDNTDFRTTKFVQELNYRRALQGELARTINQFKEVKNSRVFIVIPKQSLFIESEKPASASIQLDLISNLPSKKLAAIVHLAASAVAGLEPEQVTVVDTKGRVIFKGGAGNDASTLLSTAHLDYEREIEEEIRTNVQSMLEGIVGIGKAIVRVNADIDFNNITLNEEEYDPSATVVRSMRNIEESAQAAEGKSSTSQSIIDQRRGVVQNPAGAQNAKMKKDVLTNYEINKITRTTYKPAGELKQLSVAAVIDGSYKFEKSEDGETQKTYIPRSEEELKKFEDIVKKAMGYNEDREDQVSVSSIPFSETISADNEIEDEGVSILKLAGEYRKTFLNILLVILVFFLVIRPLLKGLKNMTSETGFEKMKLPSDSKEYARIPEPANVSQRQQIFEIAKTSPEKTEQLIKGWISEQE